MEAKAASSVKRQQTVQPDLLGDNAGGIASPASVGEAKTATIFFPFS
jgi:hypothetical protein